jgi:hypothetical protein
VHADGRASNSALLADALRLQLRRARRAAKRERQVSGLGRKQTFLGVRFRHDNRRHAHA